MNLAADNPGSPPAPSAPASPAAPAGGQPAPGAAPEGEAGRIKSLDDRFGTIEATQKEQGDLLIQIRDALAGGTKPAQGGPDHQQPDIAELVRQGVAKIEAGKDDEKRQASDKAWRKSVDDHLAEHKPAEPRSGFRARMERIVHGAEPGR